MKFLTGDSEKFDVEIQISKKIKIYDQEKVYDMKISKSLLSLKKMKKSRKL